MSLKDQLFHLDDIRAFSPDADPGLYAPADWEGTLSEVIEVEGVTKQGKIWVVSRFFNEIKHRQFALNCFVQAADTNGLGSDLDLSGLCVAFQQYLDLPTEETLLNIHLDIQEHLRDENLDNLSKKYRGLWALFWMSNCHNDSEYKHCLDKSLIDSTLLYPERDDGWIMCMEKLEESLNTHP